MSIPKTSKVAIVVTSYVYERAVVALYDANNNELIDQYVYGSSKATGRYKESWTLSRGT